MADSESDSEYILERDFVSKALLRLSVSRQYFVKTKIPVDLLFVHVHVRRAVRFASLHENTKCSPQDSSDWQH